MAAVAGLVAADLQAAAVAAAPDHLESLTADLREERGAQEDDSSLRVLIGWRDTLADGWSGKSCCHA